MMRMWPQFAYLTLIAIGIGVSMARFGEQKRDKYDVFDVVVGPALVLTILYYGGFFAPFGWMP